MAEEVQKNITIPLIHIADATAKKIRSDQIQSVGLLATKFTMEQDFYKRRLISNYGLNVLVPTDEEREAVHQIIYDELCLGQIKHSSKLKYIEVIMNLVNNGAEAIILGCTEITLLIGQQDVSVPVYDTTEIHAITAADYSISIE
jgi:aspartate racemase